MTPRLSSPTKRYDVFFSTFRFNPVRRGAQRLIGSPHVLHAAVLASFPDPSATDSGRVLWRLDRAQNLAKLIVVSPAQPDFTHLAEQAGWPTLSDSWTSVSYSKVLDRLEQGQEYRFRLTANPTHSPPPGASEKRGKVYGHVTVARQEQWLLSRQERCGFAVLPDSGGEELQLLVRDRTTISFSRRETRVTLRVASYEGVLRVTDPDAFVRTLCGGIGRAKGYGCGLLTIAPARP